MEKLVNTKFWEFHQNNSGGYFVEDDENGVCELVVIEALDADGALNRLRSIGDNVSGFWSFCSCCGERWNTWVSNDDGENTPTCYGEPIENADRGMFRERAFVHYYDGTIKEFKFKIK